MGDTHVRSLMLTCRHTGQASCTRVNSSFGTQCRPAERANGWLDADPNTTRHIRLCRVRTRVCVWGFARANRMRCLCFRLLRHTYTHIGILVTCTACRTIHMCIRDSAFVVHMWKSSQVIGRERAHILVYARTGTLPCAFARVCVRALGFRRHKGGASFTPPCDSRCFCTLLMFRNVR